MKRITKMSQVKEGDYYLIKSAKPDYISTTISKCISEEIDSRIFSDLFLIEGSKDNFLPSWEINEEFFVNKDYNSNQFNVYEIDPEDYPEYFI